MKFASSPLRDETTYNKEYTGAKTTPNGRLWGGGNNPHPSEVRICLLWEFNSLVYYRKKNNYRHLQCFYLCRTGLKNLLYSSRIPFDSPHPKSVDYRAIYGTLNRFMDYAIIISWNLNFSHRHSG